MPSQILLKTKYNPKIKEGDKFNKLTAIKYVGHFKNGGSYIAKWLFRCDCGKESIKAETYVRNGKTKTCSKHCGNYKGKNVALINHIYSKYKIGARRRNIIFSINKEQFINLIFKNCAYCGITPIQKEKKLIIKKTQCSIMV